MFLASEKQLRPNRNGNLYLQVDLSDRSGAINTRHVERQRGRLPRRSRTATSCMVDGATQLFQGNMQLIANRIRRARPDEVCEADFITLQSADDRPDARRGWSEMLRTHPDAASCATWPSAS